MAHKVIVPQKKIISSSFLNSGTLIVIMPMVCSGLFIALLQRSSWYTLPEKGYSIEHRASQAARLPSWRKMTHPGVLIFPGMKPWTAWVHFHRKYSTYRQELNHAQPAEASGVCMLLPAEGNMWSQSVIYMQYFHFKHTYPQESEQFPVSFLL